MTATVDSSRFTIAGTATVVRFNWPKYASAVGLVGAALVGRSSALPAIVRGGVVVAAVAGGWWTVASLVATWWVYDHRRAYAQVGLGLGSCSAWAIVHAGFDESTAPLTGALGTAPAAEARLTLPVRASLRRARRTAAASTRAAATEFAAGLPASSGSLDAVFLTFAVHEVRDVDDQRALFADIHRVLRPDGRLVVTEFGRDVANAAVYGPAILHFQAAAVWRQRAGEAGFGPAVETAITPFVRRFVWTR